MLFCIYDFLKRVRASPDREGPWKRSWSEWRPHVVWTLTVGDGLIQLVGVLRSVGENGSGPELSVEHDPVLCVQFMLDLLW